VRVVIIKFSINVAINNDEIVDASVALVKVELPMTPVHAAGAVLFEALVDS
jgi:hypothetical protein